MVIHPVREAIVTPGADPRGKLLAAADAAALPSSKTRHLLEQIEKGEEFFGIESLAPVFHQHMAPFFDYLPAGTPLVIEDPEAFLEEARRSLSRLRESAAHRRAEHRLALDPHEFELDEEEARATLAGRRRLELRPVEVLGGAAAERIRLVAEPNTSLRGELLEARGTGDDADLGKALRERLVAPTRGHADRLSGVLKAFGLEPVVLTHGAPLEALVNAKDAALAVMVGPLQRGFRLPADRLALVSEEEIFGAKAHREVRRQRAPGMADLGDLGEIVQGDPVVHDEHGVGRYRGLKM